MISRRGALSEQIRKSEATREAVNAVLATDQRVLERITEGIYRQPASALRELVSNAYDADASEVVILTDAPRFAEISVRDDGNGLSPEALEHLVEHIGGSAKRTEDGASLGVVSQEDQNRSPGGRQLIGKLGIGLFSVAQFTRHFLIITKTKGDHFRTVADIILGPSTELNKRSEDSGRPREITTGHARIWREHAPDEESHGTEVKLLELLPRTRAELASDDLWARIDFEKEDPPPAATRTNPPSLHIGRMLQGQSEILEIPPRLPWTESDDPRTRFSRLVEAIRRTADTVGESVDLDSYFDNYLRTLWTLSLAAPLEYYETHPFDLPGNGDFLFFRLENSRRGQAVPLDLESSETPRTRLGLRSPDGSTSGPFRIYFDGVQLFRPILYSGLPKTSNALQTPLLFVGLDDQQFENKPASLTGGPLRFEAYLFWAPKIIPTQHQGVVLRVGNASGSLFDRTFLGYQVSEQTRLRQITAEVFVHVGLDAAINLDRESFNYAHPHYQYLVRWLHSAFRQFANRHKELGSIQRSKTVAQQATVTRAAIEQKVEDSLKARGIHDVPRVLLLDVTRKSESPALRGDGSVVMIKQQVLPPPSAERNTGQEIERQRTLEAKAIALTQLLTGWGLLENLSYEEQQALVHDIINIFTEG